MNFSKYTTQELEFITSNIELLKKELEKRNIREYDDFPFKIGDVIHSKPDNYNYLIKIKDIDKRNNNLFINEITIGDDGSFGNYINSWYNIDRIDDWSKYVKIEDSKIFENILNIINEYDDEVQQLHNDTYLKLKNEIAPYDYNV